MSTAAKKSVCPRCHKRDRMRGEWCDRCFSWAGAGDVPRALAERARLPWRPAPDFDGPELAAGGAPAPAEDPDYGTLPDAGALGLSPSQRAALGRLAGGKWLAVDRVVGKALEARGLVEHSPTGAGGKWLFRRLCHPGPYGFRRKRLTLVQQAMAELPPECGGERTPEWQVYDTRDPDDAANADSEWHDEEDAWAECDRRNRAHRAAWEGRRGKEVARG